MKIISWNVNGIRAAARKGLLDRLKEHDPDILCIQETKAWREQLDDELASPEGYNTYFDEAQKKGYSGTALFTKREPISVERGLGIEEFDTEGRVVRAEFEDFHLYNVYFPNGQMNSDRLDYKMRFYEAILKQLTGLKESGKNIIVCGDVNTAHTEIDLARPKDNEKVSGFLPMEREWMDRFCAAGFKDSFRLFNKDGGNYTWWSLRSRARERNVGWRIDYIFVSDSMQERVKGAFTLPEVHGSDHCPVGIELY